MVNICRYSILIYAGNVTIVLIVAITTDYWEYRGFDTDAVNRSLAAVPGVRVVRPDDTESYMVVNYRKPKAFGLRYRHRLPLGPERAWKSRIVPYGSSHIGTGFYAMNESTDEPPLFMRRYFSHSVRDDTQATKYRRNNIWPHAQGDTEEVIIVLYWQYGNLFRECDNLEAHVRERLAMSDTERKQCYNFFVPDRPGTYLAHIPDVAYLEMTAFTSGILCIGCMASSLVFGAMGSLDKSKTALLYASGSSLAAGFFLILSIALFNGKSHLIRRRDIALGPQSHYHVIVDALNTNRKFTHGWSFVLAWICVALCFVSSFVWLYKRDKLDNRRLSVRQRYIEIQKYMSNYVD